MTWPGEGGHISRTKGHRRLRFSENLVKGSKSSYSKSHISSPKNVAYSAQSLSGGITSTPPAMCGRGLIQRRRLVSRDDKTVLDLIIKYLPTSSMLISTYVIFLAYYNHVKCYLHLLSVGHVGLGSGWRPLLPADSVLPRGVSGMQGGRCRHVRVRVTPHSPCSYNVELQLH